MICLDCKKETPPGREICPECYHPIKPIPIPSGGKIRFGEYDWYVLDRQDDRALILTEKVIDTRAYHDQEVEVTWETCDLRKYLNGEFYNSFGESDRARIIKVTKENNDNPWYGTNGGNPTTDGIFLLSIDKKMGQGQISHRQEPISKLIAEHYHMPGPHPTRKPPSGDTLGIARYFARPAARAQRLLQV
jgi:hypothetical protein